MRLSRSAEPQRAATARARFEPPKIISANLFRTVFDQLADDRRRVILDLGTIHPTLLELLEGRRCRLDVADIIGDLRARERCDVECIPDWLRLPLLSTSEPADIVLCWDLLNYLDRDTLTGLMAEIAKRCREGALVHALVVYSERLMHEFPGQLIPFDAATLVDVSKAPSSRPAPRYSTEALSLAMPDYTIERVRLLSNGMQEYLFKTRG